MSDKSKTRFVREIADQKLEKGPSTAQSFSLTELIDPREIGVQKFTYDSEQAQNLEETNVKKAREGAKEILADAINKAKAKSSQIREEAHKLGYDEGKKEGFKKGEDFAREEFANLYSAFEDHNRQLSEFRRKMYGKVEREMIEMVVAISKKVIYHELSTRENSVQQMIQLAVESVLDKESMIIKVHPEDKSHAENFRPELQKLFDEIKNITFEVNPGLERGGCMIETNFGTIDARLHHLGEQIDKILTLTPMTFEEGQTQFPKREQPEKQKEHTAEEIAEQKAKDEVEDSAEGNGDDFDFPVLDPDQKS